MRQNIGESELVVGNERRGWFTAPSADYVDERNTLDSRSSPSSFIWRL